MGGSGFAGLTERAYRVKPVIACVNGLAHGGGFETCLACDIVVAQAETAHFALPEPKVGLIAAAGGIVRLPRLIGHGNAMRMLLTGRKVSAEEGLRLGFVQAIATRPQTAMDVALDMASEILMCSPDSIQATMEIASQSGMDPEALSAPEA